MFDREKLFLFQKILLLFFGIIASFVNYCIFQCCSFFIFPLTIIPISVFILRHQTVPISVIILLGIIDDLMLNAYAGIHCFAYLFSAHFILSISNSLKKCGTLLILSYFVINCILFVSLNN